MEDNIQTTNNNSQNKNKNKEYITKAEVEQCAVDDYCKAFPNPEEIDLSRAEGCILHLTYLYFSMHNANAPKDEKWRKSHKLEPHMIADILSRKYTIRKLDLGGDVPALAIYANDGSQAGTYVVDLSNLDHLNNIINRVSPAIEKRQVDEVREKLRLNAPCAEISHDADLIPVANGIFDYKNKKLLPFSPDYICTVKLATAYKDHPENPVIHNDSDNTDWDMESWMKSLSDDPAVVDLLWHVIGAVVRAFVRWDKLIFLSGDSGCNGKGTFCELVRNLCGENYWLSLTIRDCGEKFLPAGLASKKAIITDENGVGDYIDALDKLKAMATGDVIALEAKNKDKISARFRGVIIQCLNDYVKFRDRTESLYRRLLMIPFLKRFTGAERKYIKDDYLRRPEVLEYVLWRVLNMPDYYELPEPEACRIELEKYKDANDPLRVFLAEILPQLKWQVVPFNFLYELYKKWIERYNPGGKIPSQHTFTADVVKRINTDRTNDCYAAWNPVECDPKGGYKNQSVTKEDRATPEPLILEYNLTDWMNPDSGNSNDVDKLCVPTETKRNNGRGIKRAKA